MVRLLLMLLMLVSWFAAAVVPGPAQAQLKRRATPKAPPATVQQETVPKVSVDAVEPDIDIPESLDDKNLTGDDQRAGSSGYAIPADELDEDTSALSDLFSGDGLEVPEANKIETPEPPEDSSADTKD
jgi:hypothetical protein